MSGLEVSKSIRPLRIKKVFNLESNVRQVLRQEFIYQLGQGLLVQCEPGVGQLCEFAQVRLGGRDLEDGG
jgi:hypothetical protein